MTLSAIDRNLAVITPYRIPEGQGRLTKFLEIKDEVKAEGWFCPHCFQSIGDLIPVTFKICQGGRRSHFAHSSSGKPCSKATGESLRHDIAKIALANYIESKGKLAAIELNVRDPGLGLQCRPDVVATYLEEKEAHEVQLSKIEVGKLKARTDIMIQMGFKKVSWYLYGSNYNEANREYLDREPKAQCYHLTFGENNTPQWRPDRGFRTTPIENRSTPYDRCKKRKPKHPKGRRFASVEDLVVDGFTYWSKIDTVVSLVGVKGPKVRVRAPGDREHTVDSVELLHPHHPSLNNRFMQNSHL